MKPTLGSLFHAAVRALHRLADLGDVDGFRAYVRGEAFLAALAKSTGEQRHGLLRTYATCAIRVEERTKLKLAAPKRRGGIQSVWAQPAEHARLARAYAIAGEDHEKAGRLLGITAGAARLARKRHLAAATERRQSAA